MAYIGKNPKLKSSISEGDTLVNLTAEPRVAGRWVFATDQNKYYYDDGISLKEAGDGAISNTVDPTATDDSYRVGQLWLNTTTNKVYICMDNTSTAALWVDLTAAGSGGGGMDIPTSIIATTGSYTVPAGSVAIVRAMAYGGMSMAVNGTTVLNALSDSWATLYAVSAIGSGVDSQQSQRHLFTTNAGSAPISKATGLASSTARNRAGVTQTYTLPSGTVITGNCYKLIEVY